MTDPRKSSKIAPTVECPECGGRGYYYIEADDEICPGILPRIICDWCEGRGLVYPRWVEAQANDAIATMLDHLVNDKERTQ